MQIEQNSKAEAQKFLANGEVSAAIEADAQGRRARGKILYAKSAARKVVKMEERLRTMQKYRVGQEMLEDGVGPLVRRIEQLHRLVCKTGSPTAQFVIRGSVTFLQDQLKRQSRKLHWDMKRSEQHEIVEESMRELEAEAALALKVENTAAWAAPQVETMISRLKAKTEEAGPFVSTKVVGMHLERLERELIQIHKFGARARADSTLLSGEVKQESGLLNDLQKNELLVIHATDPLNKQLKMLEKKERKGANEKARRVTREEIRNIEDAVDKVERRVRRAISVRTSPSGRLADTGMRARQLDAGARDLLKAWQGAKRTEEALLEAVTAGKAKGLPKESIDALKGRLKRSKLKLTQLDADQYASRKASDRLARKARRLGTIQLAVKKVQDVDLEIYERFLDEVPAKAKTMVGEKCVNVAILERRFLRRMRREFRAQTEAVIEETAKMGASAPEKPLSGAEPSYREAVEVLNEMVATSAGAVKKSIRKIDKEIELVRVSKLRGEAKEKYLMKKMGKEKFQKVIDCTLSAE